MEFVATEAGFADGMGGASNSVDSADYHYVLFGQDTDELHPKFSGVYFEFDDQIHGAVDCVNAVVISEDRVIFELRDGQKIVVRSGMSESQWFEFLRGIRDAFGEETVHQG